MNKFILKFLALFVFGISLLFFSLIFFNEKNMRNVHPFRFENFERRPPVSIPFIFIVLSSSVFVFLILKYIDKNFVAPLLEIENNVKKIKSGELDVKFKTKSENIAVKETFNILNDMVTGLKQKEKLQNEFIQNLVHDLRAPVIAQERAVEILSEEFQDNSLIQAMVQNNESYLKIINSIIETFTYKKIVIEKTYCDLNKIADTCFKALEPVSRNKNITLLNDVPKNFMVFADYISINRIILNLVSNSIENIENDKTLKIKAEMLENSAVITVEDNGSGLDMKDVFMKRNGSGKKIISGLGLQIVQELVLKNGGNIKVESKKNEFTKFIIKFPYEA